MPRPTRFAVSDIPQCVVQAGINWARTFNYRDDYQIYLDSLRQAASQYECELHAFALLPNRVQLLVTPHAEQSVPQMMQSLGRRYVQYFNRRYDRSGTLWQGRYKSCLVEPGEHLLNCYLYVDTLSAITGVVNDPLDYAWSSLRQHVGVASHFVRDHETWLALGQDAGERYDRYRRLAAAPMQREMIKDININVVQGSVYGSEEFRALIESRCGQKVRPRPRGRPRLRQAG
jgi:putative transposase